MRFGKGFTKFDVDILLVKKNQPSKKSQNMHNLLNTQGGIEWLISINCYGKREVARQGHGYQPHLTNPFWRNYKSSETFLTDLVIFLGSEEATKALKAITKVPIADKEATMYYMYKLPELAKILHIIFLILYSIHILHIFFS